MYGESALNALLITSTRPPQLLLYMYCYASVTQSYARVTTNRPTLVFEPFVPW